MADVGSGDIFFSGVATSKLTMFLWVALIQLSRLAGKAVVGETQEGVMGGEYDQSTLYTHDEIYHCV